MRVVMAAVLAVAVLVLGAVVGVMWADLRALRGADADGVEATAAARTALPELMSYDYRTVDRDLARARSRTTGALSGYYGELARSLAGKARAQRTVQTASVTAAAVERAEPGRVEVLLFVNTGTVREVPGEAAPQRQISQNRVRLTMVRGDRGWLAADLSTLIGTV
ncbi:hypothetical protein [Nonomuraea rhodomycinica]|uniref:Mce-associated membrane protein n=1 Tax=Nonomuraea rhodomycinica TaxID=1712872 RepID=A0A7Y6IXJ1_9ACTN|nr:hypothetical protein [Nonomuraea rhodomycinica]NUW45683.1 hypothetical protein [Nonomuraea rhodomycinica]